MVYVTRRETFNAAHKLHVADWSDEKNKAVFGKCSNKNWHGHNYELFVTVVGQPDEITGYVMDAKVLSDIVKTKITKSVDHSNMNLDVDWFPKNFMPSTENVAIQFWNRIEAEVSSQGATLYCIRLHETENIYAEYFGPNGK
ncbi:6-pyruvoyl trahydropterin synthase family protein [Neolewinella antarctica]|uniref:6-carboxy-5,6,7,8-tetrahydropterin synthase n=1 Tax=Neolewinella antarctica TaxID=442734 RepID=A0ABX0X7A0_9BACT|nr:6-carboxytetrahydropterin synthase [Neolewinella antarctica]NJC24876.1 6-pyruvoyltetrahydropterin/6-carboxytetrahydropterin synthase [Neolewinella antarctica]